jgi:predicted dehydrogenase
MEVVRTLIADAAGPVAPKKPASQSAAPMNRSTAPTPQQVTLIADDAVKGDPGGMVDHGIHDGDTLRYVAQRVLTLQLTPPPAIVTGKKGKQRETQPGPQTLKLKSEPSPSVTFTFHDVIPPAAPTGLAAITGGGFGETPSIDLSWEPNSELDVVGYNVYRAGADSHFGRLNRELVMGPEFRDTTVEAGKTYFYRVTAVDQHHNESAPSSVVKAEVRR